MRDAVRHLLAALWRALTDEPATRWARLTDTEDR